MREIKFRAWDKTMNMMIYQDDTEFEFRLTGKGIEVDDLTFVDTAFNEKHEDIDCEVMQYTGLKDKNRVEIYEDDIIKHLDGECSFIGVVQYSPFGWYVKADEDNISFEHFADDTSCIADCRVIGNTYEEQKFKEVAEDEM